MSTIAQAPLDNLQYKILYTVYYYIVLYCIPNPGTVSFTPGLIISVVLPLFSPPISRMPASVDQLVWNLLLSVKAWLVTHWPEVKLMQVFPALMVYPPHICRVFMVWPDLTSGSEGSEHPLLASWGLNSSTLVYAP